MALPKANKSPRGFKCKDKVPIERQAIPVMAITKPKKKLTLKSNFLTKMQLIRPTNYAEKSKMLKYAFLAT